MTLPSNSEQPSSYSVVKTFEIDGLKIECIQKDQEEEQPVDVVSECGDDTSTICLEDAETIKAEMKDSLDDELFYLENSEKILAPIVEEVPAVEESEEGYEGAAGLWAKDYQLPCFNSGVVLKPQQFLTTQRVDEVLLKSSSRLPTALDLWPTAGDPKPMSSRFSQPYTAGDPMPSKYLQPYTAGDPMPSKYLQPYTAGNPMPQSSKSCQQPSVFNDLIDVADEPLVFSKEPAVCGFCKRDVARGVMLKDCLHVFCRRCLVYAIENNQDTVMMCPSRDVVCQGEVRDEEIKALLNPEAYEKYTNDQLVRMQILDLAELYETYDFVENKNEFSCGICLVNTKTGDGIVLKSCLHQYCKPCLGKYIQISDEAEIPCPFRDEKGAKCIGIIMDTELRSLIPLEPYLALLKKSLKMAEDQNPNAYHCKTPDCPAWVEIDGELDAFECPACRRQNCVRCKAVHQGVSCQDYQEMIHGDVRRARELAATENQVQNLIASRNAMPCPRCGIITQRIDGCRHMTCTKCRHEFQWTGN